MTQENGLPPIIGQSQAIRKAIEQARQLAASGLSLLLVGASGTGKELFAQYLHYWSGRRGKLVAVNCAAIPGDLLEGLLFGTRRGVYTGAVDRVGLVEAADHGTLFLDEIEAFPLDGQAKLLRVLESGEVQRLGETGTRRAQFRLVSAAQADLRQRVVEGAFRLDLFERIAPGLVTLPSLRERASDVLLLAAYFAARQECRLGPGVEPILVSYHWPGNVRELRTVIERAACLSGKSALSAAAIAEAVDATALPQARDDGASARAADRRRALVAAGRATGWNAQAMAARLGIGLSSVYRWLTEARISLRWKRNSHFSQRIPEKTEKIGSATQSASM